MDSHKLVSVIIPVFNAQAHIEDTLTSLINQDYENLELVIVDDASTDSSMTLAEKLLSESTRDFTIINTTQNLGVSAARNKGLDSAKGEYVLFCDADDLAERNLISELAGLSAKFDSDISFGGMVKRFEDGKLDEVHRVRVDCAQPIDGELALYLRMIKPIAPTICCMLFKKSLLTQNNIRFCEGCTAFEDIEFQMKAFCHAKSVSYSKECLYIYVHSSDMGSVRDNDTYTKKLRRYIDSSQAHFRTAEYLVNHSHSTRTKNIAENLLMPEAIIRKFTVCAMSDDKSGFDSLLKDKSMRKAMLSSLKVLFLKPEIFFKALSVLLLPSLYFRIRRGKYK